MACRTSSHATEATWALAARAGDAAITGPSLTAAVLSSRRKLFNDQQGGQPPEAVQKFIAQSKFIVRHCSAYENAPPQRTQASAADYPAPPTAIARECGESIYVDGFTSVEVVLVDGAPVLQIFERVEDSMDESGVVTP